MSDTTQRLCANHSCQISFVFDVYFVWFPLHGGCKYLGAGFGVLHATQLIRRAARLLYF